ASLSRELSLFSGSDTSRGRIADLDFRVWLILYVCQLYFPSTLVEPKVQSLCASCLLARVAWAGDPAHHCAGKPAPPHLPSPLPAARCAERRIVGSPVLVLDRVHGPGLHVPRRRFDRKETDTSHESTLVRSN